MNAPRTKAPCTKAPRTNDETAAAAAEFDRLRPRLVGIAYGLLGSVDEAEDVVQDAWLRLCGTDRAAIADLTGWLIVTTSRLAQDVLRSARHRREAYVGPWLPEPLISAADTAPGHVDPAERVTLDESLSMALLVVLESLTPPERTAFVLHDVFGLPFSEVAQVVGRTPTACRQLASRARRRVAAGAPRFEVTAESRRHVIEAFAAACREGDITALLTLLDPDVVLRADGGGVVRAARRPVLGADKVSRYLVGVCRKAQGEFTVVAVNGLPGLLWSRGARVNGVLSLTVAEGRITAVDLVRNPEKLSRTRPATVADGT
ncbi:RNA polymerase sigma factor SigJ [Streptomyces sp. NPDC126499]|uniref:RNA polymerase sigma factor SigJ n=1 Tax=Streptomyces sp. NPDC126499 TaxID=3155314 RepID=UPI00331F8472